MRKEPLDWFAIASTVAKLRTQGLSWQMIGERYGRTGAMIRDGFHNHHHQQQRALQQSKSDGCVPSSPAQVD